MEKYVVINNYKTRLIIFLLNYSVLFFMINNDAHAHYLVEQSGWIHPLSGIDHIIAMIAVGAWSTILGKQAIWIVPGFFVLFMFLGSLIGIAQVELPYTETGIALSVLVLGFAIATNGKIPTIFAAICTAIFGICHGFAHGYELPVIDHAATYIIGFIATTIMLHILGVVLGYFLLKKNIGKVILKSLGVISSIIGIYLLVK